MITEKLKAVVEGDISHYQRQMGRVSDIAEGTGNRVGRMMEKGLLIAGAAAVTWGAVSIKSFMSFEKAMAEVSTLVDTSVVDMKGLSDQVLELSKRYGTKPVKQAEAFYQIISAGVTDSSEAMVVLEQATKASIAGLTDQETAADALTGALNAYGLSTEAVERISDIMFKTVVLGKTRFGELSDSMGKVLPIAGQVGVSFEEIMAATATLTKINISTREAMTALRSILVMIIKPTTEASETAAALGLEFSAAALEAKGLQGFLKEVKEAVGDNVELLPKLFGNVRGLTGVMSLAGKSADEFADILDELTDSAGATEVALEKMMSVSQKTADRFWSNMESMKIATGSFIIDFIGGLYLIWDVIDAVLVFALTGFFIDWGQTIDRIIEKLKTIAWEAVKLGWEIVKGLASVVGDLWDAGEKLIGAILGGIKSAAKGLLNYAKDLRDKILKYFKFWEKGSPSILDIIDTSMFKVQERFRDWSKERFSIDLVADFQSRMKPVAGSAFHRSYPQTPMGPFEGTSADSPVTINLFGMREVSRQTVRQVLIPELQQAQRRRKSERFGR